MTAIATTSDYITWDVELGFHTEAERSTYIASLDITDSSTVRKMVIQTVDKVVIVNGIPFLAPLFENKETAFDTALGTMNYRDSKRVKAVHYFSDRDYVLIEYMAHPADPAIENTEHTLSDLGTFLPDMFAFWKTHMTDLLAGNLQSTMITDYNLP